MNIFLHKTFVKKYKKAGSLVQRRFKKRRNLFLVDPHHPILHNHPLSGDRTGQWSINVTGDWRALYVWKDQQSVIFVDLDTHSNLYK